MVKHYGNPSYSEAEAGALLVQGQREQLNEILSQKNTKQNEQQQKEFSLVLQYLPRR